MDSLCTTTAILWTGRDKLWITRSVRHQRNTTAPPGNQHAFHGHRHPDRLRRVGPVCILGLMDDNTAASAIKTQVKHRREYLGLNVEALAKRLGCTVPELGSLDFNDSGSALPGKLEEVLEWRRGSIAAMWESRKDAETVSGMKAPELEERPDPFTLPGAARRPAAHLTDAELTAELTYRLLSR